jgi:lipopolysaccharide transport system ATP-binding protein
MSGNIAGELESQTPLLSLRGVGCRYSFRKSLFRHGYYEALKDVSFDLYRGETLGVIGRNGAGKSTLLRLIADILKPDRGKIVRHSPASIALLTLQLGFSNEISGRDNAILSAMLMGHSRKQVLDNIEQIKEFSELGDWFEEPIKSYSTGMRARLGFAVALEMSPDVMLVDEVLGVGDESFRIKSTQAMKEKMETGQTVVFVSHNLATLRELCPRTVWIKDGVTQMQGKTDEVLKAYRESLAENQ